MEKITILPAFLIAVATLHAAEPVTWTTPSKESLDSMPLSGRLGAGANVWVQDGSIWLYLGHSGAFNSQGILNKLGCVRITPVGITLGSGSGFKQELDPATGTITISQGAFQSALWFSADNLIVQSAAGKPMAFDVSYATWRDKRREGVTLDLGGNFTVEADHIAADTSGFVWHCRNAEHPRDTIGIARGQNIPPEAVLDTVGDRVFGGALAVAGGISNPVATPKCAGNFGTAPLGPDAPSRPPITASPSPFVRHAMAIRPTGKSRLPLHWSLPPSKQQGPRNWHAGRNSGHARTSA